MVAWGGLGGVTVVGGWHKNVMIDRVTGDNGDGSGRQGQVAAELEAKDRFRIYKPVQEHVGKNVLGSDPVMHKSLKSSDEH